MSTPESASLVERLRDEMRQSWRRGERLWVEDYLTLHPELRNDDETLLDFLYAEFCIREALGDNPRPDEYRRRFPHLQAPLEALFEVHGALSDGPPAFGDDSPIAAELRPDETSPPDSLLTLDVEEEARQTAPAPQLHDYELLAPIGAGGMGVVYKARQRSLNRVVALKTIRAGELASEEEVKRFMAEAHAAARLKHPAIVAVYDAGEMNGRHFFSMEFVEGRTLASLAQERPFEPRRAARCLRSVAEAIHYAHGMGVLHRDLKPANILLDADEGVHVADFGLARQLDAPEGLTLSGRILGTPNYMPPEQAQGRLDCLGPVSDVYALGAIFYELLTGRPPFQAPTLLETLRLVTESPPVPPCRLNAAIPRDAETICLKCLEKLPARRYGSAHELAEDVRRFLAGEPIRARPASAMEKAVKWARRRPWQAALVGGTLLAALVIFSTVTVYNYYLNEALTDAQTQRNRAQSNEQIAQQQTQLAERRLERAQRSLYALQLQRAAAFVNSDPAQARTLLEDRERCPEALRDFTWRLLYRQSRRQLQVFSDHVAGVRCLAVDGVSGKFATGDASGAVIVQSLEGTTRRRITAHAAAVNAVVFLKSGAVLATAGEDHAIRMWDVRSGAKVGQLDGHTDNVNALAAAPGGGRLVSGAADGRVLVWDVAQGRSIQTLNGHASSVFAVAVAPDGHRLASAGKEGIAFLWDEAGNRLRTFEGHEGAITCLAFSPTGDRLATGGVDRTLRLWDVDTGAPILTLQGHESVAASLAFSSAGALLASASYDRTARLWDVATGSLLATLTGHDDQVWSVAFGPQSETLLTASKDRTVRQWSVPPPAETLALAGHVRPVTRVAFREDSRWLASASYDQTVRLWELPSGAELPTFTSATGWVSSFAFVGSQPLLAIGAEDGVLHWWDTLKNEVHATPAHDLWITAMVASPRGDVVLTASADGATRLWSADARKSLASLASQASEILAACFDKNGDHLATGHADGSVAVWATRNWRRLTVIPAHAAEARCAAFLSDGRRLATGGADGAIRVWDWRRSEKQIELQGHARPVLTLSLSPDDAVLASGGDDGTLRLWDPVIGEQRAILQSGAGSVASIAFSPNGQWLAAAGADGMVRVWKGE